MTIKLVQLQTELLEVRSIVNGGDSPATFYRGWTALRLSCSPGEPGNKRFIADRTVFSGKCPKASLLKVEFELFTVWNEVSIEIESV